MGREWSGWVAEAGAVLRKDLAVEFRTRYALSAVGLFGVTCLVAVSFTVQAQSSVKLQAALLWLVLLFSSLSGLARSFVAEEDGRTAESLRLAGAPTAIYAGKMAFNLLLMLALCAVLVPGYMIMMQVTWRDPLLLVATLGCGAWALSAVLTFTSALISRAHARGAVGPVIAFPLLVPILVLAMDATAAAIDENAAGWYPVRGLAAVAGIMTTVALLLFDQVYSS